jgi:hypothetical protein
MRTQDSTGYIHSFADPQFSLSFSHPSLSRQAGRGLEEGDLSELPVSEELSAEEGSRGEEIVDCEGDGDDEADG